MRLDSVVIPTPLLNDDLGFLDMEGVTGSIPVAPTNKNKTLGHRLLTLNMELPPSRRTGCGLITTYELTG